MTFFSTSEIKPIAVEAFLQHVSGFGPALGKASGSALDMLYDKSSTSMQRLFNNRESSFKNIMQRTVAGNGCEQLKYIVLRQEEIDEPLEMAETMMLGLRLVQEGVGLGGFRERFGQELMAVYGGEIREMGQAGLLEVDGERVRLTARGRLLGNEVFERFLPESTV